MTDPGVSEGLAFDNMIGRSQRMREVFAKIKSIADKDISVLIGGESGTGKELVAQAIHNHSHRKDSPYIKVNCAAIPDTLIESELFGHEKGSFTGALERKIGKFEMANHGTLFLDEIGDMTLATQSKVLRIVQEREFERIGGVRPISVNVRLISATHRDLVAEVAERRFREDLFFRLNVVSILLPPLRERRDDISPLCDFFVAKFCRKFGKRQKKLSPEVAASFMAYGWPGNIRELQNVIESAVAVEESDLITASSLPYQVGRPASHRPMRRKTDRPEISASRDGRPPRSREDAAEVPLSAGRAPEAPVPAENAPSAAPAPPERPAETPLAFAADEKMIAGAVDFLLRNGISFDELEGRILRAALERCGGRQMEAARMLGIGKGEVQYKIRKHNINVSEYKRSGRSAK